MSRHPDRNRLPWLDRAEYNLLFILAHFVSAAALQRRRAAVRRRITSRLEQAPPGAVIPVARTRGMSPLEFRRRHLGPGIPVVLEGAASDWTACRRWSFADFKARFGAETIKLVQREGLTDDDFVSDKEYSEEMLFSRFLDQAQEGSMKYMRFSPLLESFPELLDDFDHSFFRSMTGSRLGQIYQAFIGGAGTTTPLHNAMSPFFFVNVRGVKRWQLISNHYLAVLDPATDGVGYNHSDARVEKPDLLRFPGLDKLDRMEAELRPGDVLFVPAWMWHSVRNEAATIGVRCGFIHGSSIGESLTLFFTRVFAARNPTMLQALSMLFKKRPHRDKWLINPSLIRR